MNFKKFFSIIIVWIFFTNLFSSNIFAEEIKKEKIFDKTVPEITKIETIYSNKEWDFFIYWKNFWTDISNIKAIVISDFLNSEWKYDEQELKINKFYSTMITWKISWDYKNWTLIIKKKISDKDDYILSDKKYFDFWLPVLKKVEAKNWFIWWKKIIFSWENLRKPAYWLIWSKKIICENNSLNTCIITIPKDETISWKLWIESYWFVKTIDDDVSVDKTAKIKLSSYSNNAITFNVNWFKFKDLVKDLKEKKDFDDFEKWKQMDLNSKIKVNMDWNSLDNCKVSKVLKIYCPITKEIYFKWIWYIDFFWLKTSFFSYDLSKTIPYPSSFKKDIKWSTYQDDSFNTVEWNRIHIKIKINNFNYQRAKESWFWQSTKTDFKINFWWKEYSFWDKNFSVWKDSAEFYLSQFPSNMKWDIYIKFWNVKSKSIAYDFWEYEPELYRVYKTENIDEFAIEWKNLTNFNNLSASLKFWDTSLSTNDIQKILTEKEKNANEQKKKYEDFLNNWKNNWASEDELRWYMDQISKWEWILKDLKNWIYERNYKDNSKKEWEILKKSDTRIIFKIFDKDEYWKSIWKWEYEVFVTSNWITTNKIDFFYNPNGTENKAEAYPGIDNITFPRWAWDPSLIKIKWRFLDQIKELYFTDLKVKIIDKNNSELTVEVDPASIIRRRWTIIAKLKNFTMTSNLFFYNFISDKENKISLEWEKIFDKDWKPIDESANDNSDIDKKDFKLLLKNTYKDVVLKNLKIKIENLKKEDLPFYDFSLNYPWWTIKWVYDEKKSTIDFINIDFTKIIPVNEDKKENFTITFNKIKFPKWEVKILIDELNFYNDFNFPKQIIWSNIAFTKIPKFYKVEESDWLYCKELNTEWKFSDCWTELWIDDLKTNTSSFKEEVIKSDILAPKKDISKKMDLVDVKESQWFAWYVKDLYQRWIIDWYWSLEKKFKPLNKITRAEAVKMLLLARGEDLSKLDYQVYAFKDVPEWHWAKNILEYAVRNKFLTPVKNFHLQKEISRWEAAKLLVKFFQRTIPKYSKYSLLDIWKHWSSNNDEYLFQNKIISWVWDTKEFHPNDKVTRSEFVKIVSLAIKTWTK